MTRLLSSRVYIQNYDELISEFRSYVLGLSPGRIGFVNVNQLLFWPHASLVKRYFVEVGLITAIIGMIIIPPFTSNLIHVDGIRPGSDPYALNMEVQNCRETRTRLYEPLGQPRSGRTPEASYLSYDLVDCREIGEFDLSTAVLFNTQVPHRVCNLTETPRVSISFRFVDSSPLR